MNSQLNDLCVVQNRTVDSSGKVDNETWTAQAAPVRCRVIQKIARRQTSAEGAEKVQYGTYVFLNVVLPKSVVIEIHDRILWPVTGGRVYDVMAVVPARDGRGLHHYVANCDARA